MSTSSTSRTSRTSRTLFGGLIGLACLLAAAADAPLNVGDLKIRSEAGDKGATRTLAEAYYAGRGGVEQNFCEAAKWYRVLATQGDARAQTSLGLMHVRGYCFEKNFGEAYRWFSLAAAQNDAGAQNNLGIMYLEGQGVARDPSKAAFWLERAAGRGHIQAQYNLGEMYHDGNGVPKDGMLSYYWMSLAAAQGDENAEKYVKTLEAELPPGQIEQAKAKAREWLKKNRR
ncbi:MAG TPA: tetratricopeptide repeat protein [Burkholderiales bacterium]|nr:tetratricopeptide repeat protein [Burkholderiales bacterium]